MLMEINLSINLKKEFHGRVWEQLKPNQVWIGGYLFKNIGDLGIHMNKVIAIMRKLLKMYERVKIIEGTKSFLSL